jgi:hypothetical protein
MIGKDTAKFLSVVYVGRERFHRPAEVRASERVLEMPMTPCRNASRSLRGYTPQMFVCLTRKYFAERPVDTTNPLLGHSRLPISFTVNALFLHSSSDYRPAVSVVSTFSGESRRKGGGRLSQRQGILKLKFSYARMFPRRAIDKTSSRAKRTRESGRLNLRGSPGAQNPELFHIHLWKLSL